MLMLTILSAVLSLFGVLYEKTTQNKNLRIIILVAVLGFIFSISQMTVKAIGDQASGREKHFIDSIITQVNAKTDTIQLKADTIITGLKSKNFTDVIPPLLLQQVSTHGFHAEGQFVDKGTYSDYKRYFDSVIDKRTAETANYALKITLNNGNYYKLNLILDYLLTTDRTTFNMILSHNSFINDNIFGIGDFQHFNKTVPLLKYVCFFDGQNTLIGYADSKELVNELSLIYLQRQQDEFDARLNSDGVKTVTALRSCKKLVLNTGNSQEIARTLIAKHSTECVTRVNQKYYKVNLTDIITI